MIHLKSKNVFIIAQMATSSGSPAELTPQQQFVLDKIAKGENVCMLGPGGVGKSYTIKHLSGSADVATTALTGCAATLLGHRATTLHSWAGIGLGKDPLDKIVQKIGKNKKALKRWRTMRLLIVDEISMLTADLFELLDQLGRVVRKVDAPFGGLQLLFSGDFHQLPPITKGGGYCFESPIWPLTFPNQIELTTIFRQTDAVYIKILKQIRAGKISKNTDALLRERLVAPRPAAAVPTILYPVKRTVAEKNSAALAALPGPAVEFRLTEHRKLPLTSKIDEMFMAKVPAAEITRELERLRKSSNMEESLPLKVGAKVMCTHNMPQHGLFNGSRGTVVRIVYQGVEVDFDAVGPIQLMPHRIKSDEYPSVGIEQVPLVHAWAITIHKSQGMTLESAEIDIGSDVFECGQIYTALSRVKSLDGLFLTSYDPRKLLINDKVKAFYEGLVPPLKE